MTPTPSDQSDAVRALPCPFCGEAPRQYESIIGRPAAECYPCNVRASISVWNRRAATPSPVSLSAQEDAQQGSGTRIVRCERCKGHGLLFGVWADAADAHGNIPCPECAPAAPLLPHDARQGAPSRTATAPAGGDVPECFAHLHRCVRAYFRYEAERPKQWECEPEMRAVMYRCNDWLDNAAQPDGRSEDARDAARLDFLENEQPNEIGYDYDDGAL